MFPTGNHKCRYVNVNLNNDVNKYIIYVKNNLKAITAENDSTTKHWGLMTYILRQLKLCPVPLFQDHVCQLHVAYQEGHYQSLTPTNLPQQVKEKIWVLKHAQEWYIDNTSTPVMALLTTDAKHSTLEEIFKLQTQLLMKLLTSKQMPNNRN
jgi:hypothetical protein